MGDDSDLFPSSNHLLQIRSSHRIARTQQPVVARINSIRRGYERSTLHRSQACSPALRLATSSWAPPKRAPIGREGQVQEVTANGCSPRVRRSPASIALASSFEFAVMTANVPSHSSLPVVFSSRRLPASEPLKPSSRCDAAPQLGRTFRLT